jgi:ferrous iron transport protein B
MENNHKIVALIGNPNAGKSSIFNQLTGLRQKVANFPGVTVDKKIGKLILQNHQDIALVDFPGTYSLYPTTSDEKVVTSILCNVKDENFPDAIIYVADITNLEKHLLLLSQIKDLNLPIIVALNMIDLAAKEGIAYNLEILSDFFQVKFITVSGKYGINMDELRASVDELLSQKAKSFSGAMYVPNHSEQTVIQQVTSITPANSSYQALVIAHHFEWLSFINSSQKEKIKQINETNAFRDLRFQIDETMRRFDVFLPILKKAAKHENLEKSNFSDRLDDILTHKIWGLLVYFITIFLVFQSIFTLAEIPKEWIENLFSFCNSSLKSILPQHWATDLLTDGVIAGLGGIVVFIPQIAILFFLLALLEESGYMARVVFLFDQIMQKFGLNGRSMVALISGGACAIPAIMSTRTIENWKERLITILVTPLISCSARIPVYATLVAFVVPDNQYFMGFSVRGWLFTGLYLLGIVAALVSALFFKYILKSETPSSLMMEMPQYRLPLLKNTLISVFEKVNSFVKEAGKTILVISVVLWFLAYFGPSQSMQNAENQAVEFAKTHQLDEAATANLIASKKIEASYAGIMGKKIEPIIKPLGFDWKIGIALITSFAAREVFVGTMATIYSIGSSDDTETISQKMATERREDGSLVYDTKTSLSLLIFYVFALQCISTLAIVKKETGSWKWAAIQFFFMGILAYLGSFLVYNLF